MWKISLADLLNEMNNDVTFSMELVEVKKTKQGTDVTMWVSWDRVASLWATQTEKAFLIICDTDKFDKASKNLLDKNK